MRALRRLFFLYKPIILSVVSLVGSFVGFILVVYPAITRTVERVGQLNSFRTAIAQFRNKSALLAGIDESQLRDYHAALAAAVPVEPVAATIFSTVEALASQTGVSIADITLTGAGVLATGSAQTKTTLHPSGGRTLVFTVVVEGSADTIRAFISRAGRVRRIMLIKSFDFTQSTPSRARIEMEAFYAPLPTTIGSVDAEVTPLTPQEEDAIAQVASLPLLGENIVLPPALLGPAKPDPFTP